MSTLEEESVVSNERYDSGEATPNLLTTDFEFLTSKIQYVFTVDQAFVSCDYLNLETFSSPPLNPQH